MAALVLAALILIYIKTDSDSDSAGPSGSFTNREQQAIAAASTIIINLGSFSRANFDKTYQRALDSTTGSLHSQVSSNKSNTLKSLTAGKFDTSVKVRHVALEGSATAAPAKGKAKVTSYVVLISLYRYLSTSPDNPTPQDLELTVQLVSGKWLASNASSVGIQ